MQPRARPSTAILTELEIFLAVERTQCFLAEARPKTSDNTDQSANRCDLGLVGSEERRF